MKAERKGRWWGMKGMKLWTVVVAASLVGVVTVWAAAPEAHVQRSASQLSLLQGLDIPGGNGGPWQVRTMELRPGFRSERQFYASGDLVYVIEGAGRLEGPGQPPLSLNQGSVVTVDLSRDYVLRNISRTKLLKVLVLFHEDRSQRQASSKDRRTQGDVAKTKPPIEPEGLAPKPAPVPKTSDMGLVF